MRYISWDIIRRLRFILIYTTANKGKPLGARLSCNIIIAPLSNIYGGYIDTEGWSL